MATERIQGMKIPVAGNDVCTSPHQQQIAVRYLEKPGSPVKVSYFSKVCSCPAKPDASFTLEFGLRPPHGVEILSVVNTSSINVVIGGGDGLKALQQMTSGPIIYDFVPDPKLGGDYERRA